MGDFATLCVDTLQEFIKEYGEKKHRRIYNKLINASSFNKNYPIFASSDLPPNSTELMAVIQSIRFFAFSNKRNTIIAATILLMMWNGECNRNNDICDDSKLKFILQNVIAKSSNLLW